jgi:hypothetical protein
MVIEERKVRMAYILVVKHDTKGIVLIPTEIKDTRKATEQAKMENQGPGYNWENATVGYIPDEWSP